MNLGDGFDIYILCGFGHKSHDSKAESSSLFHMNPSHSNKGAQRWHVYTINLTQGTLLWHHAHWFATLCLQAVLKCRQPGISAGAFQIKHEAEHPVESLASPVPLWQRNHERPWRKQVRLRKSCVLGMDSQLGEEVLSDRKEQ